MIGNYIGAGGEHEKSQQFFDSWEIITREIGVGSRVAEEISGIA
jgi:hypothetical protein